MRVTEVGYLNTEWKHRAEHPRVLSGATRRANTSPREVEIHDARPLDRAGSLDLDVNGFIRVEHRASTTDFREPTQVQDVYIPEMSAFLRHLTGADQVFS